MITNPEHLKGLLERKTGATKSDWQISAIKGMGPEIKKYVDLIRSGSRSLRGEVARLVALVTVYGESSVNEACGELLKLSVTGMENLELTLKSKFLMSEKLSPRPLSFQNARLNRVVPVVDLRRFDALLFGSTPLNNNASEKTGENNGNQSSVTGNGSKNTKPEE